jgi:hypothetical protein
MTTEKHDPWALLREAKRLIAANRLMLGHYSGVREVGSLEDRIDAALAAHRDEGSTEDVVESETPVHDTETCCCVDCCFARNETEARRAATAAARGMR